MAQISVDRSLPKPQEFASDGSDAVGFIQFWGNSPALDLLDDPQATSFGPLAIGTSASGIYTDAGKKQADAEECDGSDRGEDGEAPDAPDLASKEFVPEPLPSLSEEGEPINVLILGGADVRHVLKTVSRLRRSAATLGARKIRFYLHETRPEVLARHVLLLQIINNTNLPARERMEIFLSIYGNSLVRERDCSYVEEIASEFIEIITDNSEHPLAAAIDLTHLKHKDRDAMQNVFQGWLKDVPFDMEKLRDQRLRGYYRDRFDYRKNLMDFDYQTHIKNRAGIINWFHYKEFCFTGVAFETRLANYSVPNRTLASYTEATDRTKGTSVLVRGYWGDIINSPYHAFCTSTHPEDRQRLFKISGSQYRHTECDVAEFNVMAYINEMDSGQIFHLPPETANEDIFPYRSPMVDLRQESQEEKVQEVKEAPAADKATEGNRGRKKSKPSWPPLSAGFACAEIVLLTGPPNETLRKPRYSGLFHRAFVGALSTMPILEEIGLTGKGGDEPFRPKAGSKVRKPPSKQAPELFGTRRDQATLALAMKPGAVVIFETMKYQAHFESNFRLSYRHRIAQAGHLAGWHLCDERHAVPRLESDMKEKRATELEKEATDFLRFVTQS